MSKRPRVSIRDIFRSYWSALRPQRWLLASMVIGMVSTQVCSVSIPVYLSRFFNILVTDKAHDAMTSALLVTTLYTVAALYVLQWIARRVFSFSQMHLEIRVMRQLYGTVFAYLIRHSTQFFGDQFSGTLTRRVSKYVSAFEVLFDSFSMTFGPALLYISGAIIVLSLHNLALGLVLAGWAVVFFAFQITVSLWRQPLRVKRSEADSAMVGSVADAISNQSAIMHFARSGFETRRFQGFVDTWQKATKRSWFADEYIWASQGLLMIGVQLGLFFSALHFWQIGKASVGDFVLIQTYALGVIDSLLGVTRELRRVYDAFADADETVAILTMPHGIEDVAGASALQVARGDIAFTDVVFGYTGAMGEVLSRFSLTIPSHQKVGLVGRSGAGKSTLVKLLLRHYDVTEGTVAIDAQDIARVTQDSLRESIGYVPQEPVLFHRTLRENITYGKLDATDAEIEQAARMAHAHDFITRLPKGYETMVGERGVKLSGGERQRIVIARAILKNAPILLLDEATSALDSESEVAIQSALHELMKGKTVIAIAHRLSTLREMDRIIVMEDGAIVEDGTHESLLTKRGVYAKLWNHQAGGFIEE